MTRDSLKNTDSQPQKKRRTLLIICLGSFVLLMLAVLLYAVPIFPFSQQIWRLNRILENRFVPANGTSRPDVESVLGLPEEEKFYSEKDVSNLRGYKGIFPKPGEVHVLYRFLSSRTEVEGRVWLGIVYKDNIVIRTCLRFSYITAGEAAAIGCMGCTPERKKAWEEENRRRELRHRKEALMAFWDLAKICMGS